MTDEVPTPVPLAREATVEGDVPCIACGYNLRTLSMNGRCPECGGEILASFRRSWLIFALPSWLGRLRTGVTIILWMLLGGIVSYIALVAVMIATIGPSGQAPSPFLIMGIMLFFGLGFTCVWLISVWYLTTPETGRKPNEALGRTVIAKWILGLSAMPIISTLAMMPITYYSMSTSPQFNAAFIIPTLFMYAGGIAFQVGFFLLMIYMRRIARRDNRKGLGKMMSFLIWGMVGMLVLGLGWGLVIGVMAVSPLTPAFSATAVSTTGPVAMSGFPYATATTGPAGTTSWMVMSAPTTSMPTTTMPVTTMPTTTMPVGGPIPFPFGGRLSMVAFFIGIVVIELFGFAWFVCAVIALFWYRSTFSRVIRENVSSLYIWE
ncbi:MAG: hypothetical protein ACE5EQ_10655 [Phycisphaerae bacterium]